MTTERLIRSGVSRSSSLAPAPSSSGVVPPCRKLAAAWLTLEIKTRTRVFDSRPRARRVRDAPLQSAVGVTLPTSGTRVELPGQSDGGKIAIELNPSP